MNITEACLVSTYLPKILNKQTFLYFQSRKTLDGLTSSFLSLNAQQIFQVCACQLSEGLVPMGLSQPCLTETTVGSLASPLPEPTSQLVMFLQNITVQKIGALLSWSTTELAFLRKLHSDWNRGNMQDLEQSSQNKPTPGGARTCGNARR